MKRAVLFFLCLMVVFSGSLKAQKKKTYDVAAYLYPAYASGDPRLRPFWPMGMGEWETVMNMQQRNPGHYWDRHPLWGYVNEADPAVMEMEIDQATRHGVNVFIFDWYWFDGRPFMETTLTDGFLKAPNKDKMKFYLMWANHNVENYWDTRISKYGGENIIWRGGVDREEFEKICKRNIEMFFKQPNYYKIDGKPVFMIYEVTTFIEGIGGVDAAIDALKWFRQEVKKAGFPDLELQFTMWSSQFNYSGVDAAKAGSAAWVSTACLTTSSAISPMWTRTTTRCWKRSIPSGKGLRKSSLSLIIPTSASAGTTAPAQARAPS